jgi:hypothetical protein
MSDSDNDLDRLMSDESAKIDSETNNKIGIELSAHISEKEEVENELIDTCIKQNSGTEKDPFTDNKTSVFSTPSKSLSGLSSYHSSKMNASSSARSAKLSLNDVEEAIAKTTPMSGINIII